MAHTVVEFEHEPEKEASDPLEDSELARRLRRMEWPFPPPGVKERCLAEILTQIDEIEPPQRGCASH